MIPNKDHVILESVVNQLHFGWHIKASQSPASDPIIRKSRIADRMKSSALAG